jgi:hypothetical protein
MITVYRRNKIEKGMTLPLFGSWKFHSIYADGMTGGKQREKDYANNFKEYNTDKNYCEEYKVEIDNDY